MSVPTIVLLHIPKTAGTSIASAMIDALGGRHCTHVSADVPESCDGQKFVFTHFEFPVVDNIRGDKIYITCVRNPVDRFVSHYRYIVSLTHAHARANKLDFVLKAKSQSFEEYILDRDRIDNEMVRQFCGQMDPAYRLRVTDLSLAVANLDRCAAIFSSENLHAEFLAATGLSVPRKNVTATNFTNNSDAHEPAPEVDYLDLGLEAMRHLNRLTLLDQVFYAEAMMMGAGRGFGSLKNAFDIMANA